MKVLTHCAAVAAALAFASVAPDALAQATQTTVNTTAPVSSETTISVGTIAGQVLQWIVAVFAVPIGSLITAWLWRLFARLGIEATDALRARLQEIVINGLNAAAKSADEKLKGRSPIEIKSSIVAGAIAYTQVHGADTIKALGLDPHSGKAVEVIRARIETAVADPTAPTPAAMNPPAPPPAPVVPDRPLPPDPPSDDRGTRMR